jgi:hypothetical protein
LKPPDPDEETGAMDVIETTLEGTIQPDGTLILDGPTNLPAGRVQVVVRPTPETRQHDGGSLLDTIRAIWADQEARGHVPRTAEEVGAELRALDDDMERELEETARLQEEGRRLREEAERNAASQ